MTVQITGESATGSVGSPSVISKANVIPTGVEGVGSVGTILIWSLIDDTQTKNYANINTDQSSSFAENSETQTPNWEEVA
jgi:predicted ATP-grasp superfamily ATP-dependent carboligase